MILFPLVKKKKKITNKKLNFAGEKYIFTWKKEKNQFLGAKLYFSAENFLFLPPPKKKIVKQMAWVIA